MADSIRLKRQATIKTVITDEFRNKAQGELTNETQLIEQQLNNLDAQYQNSLQQLEQLSGQGQNVKRQLQQLHQEVQAKKNQLTNLKMEVSKQLKNLQRLSNGDTITTGILESFVDVNVGDNIYEKIQKSEVIIEDGKVKEIKG